MTATIAGVPAGPIYRPDGMVRDPQFIARDAIHWEEHPELGRIPMPNVAPKLSETPGSSEWVGPQLGEHNAQVLGDLGYDAAQIAHLREDGAI